MNPEEISVWVPFLKRSLLFRDLSAEELEKVAVRLQPLSLPKGAVLYSRGDAGDAFYLITSGQVRLFSERGGREVLTAFLGRGDSLGELSLLTGEPRSVTVKLDATSEFLVLSKKDFEEVARGNPSILIHLSRLIAQRMIHSTQSLETRQALRRELLVSSSALAPSMHEMFLTRLALGLAEETRRRILLVDMGPQCGSLARSLGMKPILTSEAMLREQDLRNPDILSQLVCEHPSGLQALSLPVSVFGGRLYRGIFLFLNLLRDYNDYVLVSLGDSLGDVEKSILEEADGWLLLGCASRRETFARLETEMKAVSPEKKHWFRIWCGTLRPSEVLALPQEASMVVPWPDELTTQYERRQSAQQALEQFPKSARGIRRVARRLGGVSVGLAMGAGMALGYSLIGILKGLKRARVEVDWVAGTSIGSLIGGFYALGLEPEDIEDIALRVDKAWVYENLFWDLTIPRAGIFAGTTLYRFIRSYFGEKEFHEMEIPFACVATDIETGERVILREGRVAEAIRASCGVPLLLAPFQHQGRFLVDGGLVEPVPSRVVSQMGADILISVNLTLPTFKRKRTTHPASSKTGLLAEQLKELGLPEALQAPNMLQVLFQMIYAMEYEIAQSRLDPVHVVIQPEVASFSWTELHRAREIIERGERAVEEALPKIRALLPYFRQGEGASGSRSPAS
ncbi:MAG: patatin-like phospholipase family protein [Elusimicrobia bacterium]|nr:patatin-like phospholipase family protein [Elusimicrobiota bacterium]